MSEYSVKKPITVLMSMLIVIVLGIFSVTKLKVTLLPDMELPFMVVATTYEGANPYEVEEDVTSKIEGSVTTMENFSSVTSTSNEHFSLVMVTFEEGSNLDTAYLDLNEKINTIDFVDGVKKPMILKFSPSMMPAMAITINKDFKDIDESLQLIENTKWVTNDVIPMLQNVSGIANVSTSGVSSTSIRIEFDDTLLAKANLTQESAIKHIEDMNIESLAGIVPDSDGIKLLYVGNNIDGLDELKNLAMTTNSSNELIRLKDLVVEDGIKLVNDNVTSYNKVNGKEAITLTFQFQSNASIVDVSKEITSVLKDLEKSDSLVSYDIIMDQAEYINMAVGSVTQNLIFGGILAIIILFLFLRDIKPTLIVGLSIPISVVGAFILMYFTGMNLNMISMGGLALGIGMLVDNSVVVIENIYRLLGEGKSKVSAAIEGSKQVIGAITASTATTIAVFLPILFTEGMIADIFMNLAYTVTFSLVASLFIALTLVPSISAKLLNEQSVKQDGKVMQGIRKFFDNFLSLGLKFKKSTLVITLLLFVLSFVLIVSKGFIMMPTTDEGQISATVTYIEEPEFADLSKEADLITSKLMSDKSLEIDLINTKINNDAGMMAMFAPTGGVTYTISLKENSKLSTKKSEKVIEDILLDYYEDDIKNVKIDVAASNQMTSMMSSTGVSIKVSGNDLEDLEVVANSLTTKLSSLSFIEEANNGIKEGTQNVKIVINKDEAVKRGVTTLNIIDSISLFYKSLGISMDQNMTDKLQVEVDGISYEITTPQNMGQLTAIPYYYILGSIHVFNDQMLAAINKEMAINEDFYPYAVIPQPTGMEIKINPTIVYKTNEANEIVFGSILDPAFIYDDTLANQSKGVTFEMPTAGTTSLTNVSYTTGFATINSDGNSRYLTVSGVYKDGVVATKVASQIEDLVNDYLKSDEFNDINSNVKVIIQGESEEIMEAVLDLVLAGLISILLVYMIMAIQFQNLKYPFIVMFTVPLAFTGGFAALFITNTQLSMVSIMGLIILVGIVVNNGIVLIDYINKLKESNPEYTLEQRVKEASKTRLRPILMTSLTTILALSTTAIGIGQGSEMMAPMGIASIGGLIYSTILTVVIVPIIYVLFNKKNEKTADNK